MTKHYGPSAFERKQDRCPLCGTAVGDLHDTDECPPGEYDGDARNVHRYRAQRMAARDDATPDS
jgi:hypothetical protein